MLAPSGLHIPNSGRAGMGYLVRAFVQSIFVRQQGRPYVSKPDHKDMDLLRELVASGKLKPVIDRIYRLRETAEALAYVGEGHVPGKVVITVFKQEPPIEDAVQQQRAAEGAAPACRQAGAATHAEL